MLWLWSKFFCYNEMNKQLNVKLPHFSWLNHRSIHHPSIEWFVERRQPHFPMFSVVHDVKRNVAQHLWLWFSDTMRSDEAEWTGIERERKERKSRKKLNESKELQFWWIQQQNEKYVNKMQKKKLNLNAKKFHQKPCGSGAFILCLVPRNCSKNKVYARKIH